MAALVAAIVVGKRQNLIGVALGRHTSRSRCSARAAVVRLVRPQCGSALAANAIAGLAFVRRCSRAATCGLTFLDAIRSRSTAVGAATAIVVGLVAVETAAGSSVDESQLLLVRSSRSELMGS